VNHIALYSFVLLSMRKLKSTQAKLRRFLTLPNAIALLVLGLCGAIAWWAFTHAGLNLSNSTHLVEWMRRLDLVGIPIYVGFLALAIIISPIPSTPITIAAGAAWGPLVAGLYGVVGIFLGCLVAYFIGRTLGRSAVQVLTGKVVYLSRHRGNAYLGWLMFVTHLIPVLPFDLMSYGAGISGMSFPIYAATTLLGVIPCTFFLTYMGAAFALNWPMAIAMVVSFLVLAITLPWGVKRYNWLGLRDVIHLQ
jgi:uncharacterized membrane protein YdjX (TVP38/TMEM64 family)